jgi:dTDP-4-dehydrorhamnose reductase
MQNTKILIFGRIGQVGWELRHKLACLGQSQGINILQL